MILQSSIRTIVLVGSATVSLGVGSASAETGRFQVSLSIPEVCGLSANSLQLMQGQEVAQTTIHENCNQAFGFAVIAGHRELSAGENVQIEYDGMRATLDPSGFSQIAFRPGARFGAVTVTIRAEGLREALSVGLSVSSL